MRPTLQFLLALVLATLMAAPVAAATTGGATEETLTGVMDAVHVDDFAGGREHERYFLTSGAMRTELEFADGGPGGLGGATVTVTGTRVGHALRVQSSSSGHSFHLRSLGPVEALTSSTADSGSTGSGPAVATSTSTSAVAKSIAAVLINFTDLSTRPYTTAAVQSALLTSTTSLKAFFEEESKGRMTVSGAVFGWYTIPSTTAGCNWSSWITLGTNAATAAGVDLGAYTNVMFIFPGTTQCGFAGLGYVPGKYSLLNGTTSVQVMTHEVGHNFGLGHANARTCTVGGTPVTIAADASCTTQPYADPFSTMGNNALRHNQGSQLGELGWLTDAEKVVGTPGRTYTITPYLGVDGVKLVRIPRGDGSYFDLDLRTPYGTFDNFAVGSPAVSGVTIRLGWGTASPTTSPKATELLDTTPATASLTDAPLLVGRTMADPVSTISITTMSISSAGVVVRVREGIAPSAPTGLSATAADDASSVTLAWGAATDNTAVASYRIARGGTTVATVAATATTWTDASVAGSTTYAYTVTAIDTSTNAGPAASTAITTPPTPPPPPPPPPPPRPDPSATPSPDPSATPSPDPSATPSPDPTAAPTPDPTPAPTPDPTPAPTAPDTQAPTAPDPLTGTPATTTVSLAWGASTDDVGVAGYVITRNASRVATATGTTWRDIARTPLTTYTYTIAAVDAAGHTSAAATVTVRTSADRIRPTTPARFHVVRRSGAYVTFAWRAATDNVKVVKYLVFRYGFTTPVARTTSTSIRISTRAGARYFVRAVDAAGNRSYASAIVRGR
jgi:outer membrane biosynthesis protein TonB